VSGPALRFLLPGGSGQIGTLLARALSERGHTVTVLSRVPAPAPWRTVAWDARSTGPWVSELEAADVVINLAGRSVNCRYTPANRREILSSRVDSTRAVGRAIAAAECPPRLWLQMSTATIYAHRFDAPNDEATGIIGGREADVPDAWRFSIEVATAWEAALQESDLRATRRVALRSALVLSPDAGGIFDTLMHLVRYGLGGRAGNGKQFVSWIHEADFVESILWIVAQPEFERPVNLAAPTPLPQARFMADLRRAAGVPIGLPATRWMLELGARFLKTETELILKSRRVVPGRLLTQGFGFHYPAWPEAAADLTRRWRQGR
jgi:uncharacterized protein (TIGR01777 family)